MSKQQKISLFLLRVVLGWMFFYAGITKVLNPDWTAAGYLKGAKAFTGFYGWLADAGVSPLVDFANEWGLTLLGVSLVLGALVRLSSVLGMLLMVLYYLPLGFPMPNTHAYIVDEHIIYIAALFALFAWRAGRSWGLDRLLARNPKLNQLG